MFSATDLLGALVDDKVAPPPSADADSTSGMLESMPSMPGGTTGKMLLGAAGVAAAGGLAYAAYRHFKQPDAGGAAPPAQAGQGGLMGAQGPTDAASSWLGSPMGAQPTYQPPVANYANSPTSWGSPHQAPAPGSSGGPLQAPVPGGAGPASYGGGYPGVPMSQVPTVAAPAAYGAGAQTQPNPAHVDPSQPWSQQPWAQQAALQAQAPQTPQTPWAQQMPPRPQNATTVLSPPDVDSFPTPARAPAAGAGAEAERLALLLVRAMIAAANVDGVIDASERQRIVDRVTAAGLGAAERAALEHELSQPQPPFVLLGQLPSPSSTGKELAEQFYVVSVLGVSCDTDAERAYLRGLPYVLGMRPEDVARLHARLGVAPP